MAALALLTAAAACASAAAGAAATAAAEAAAAPPPPPAGGPALRGGGNVSGAAPRPGCLRVEEFVVSNRCDKSIFLEGWDQVIDPGQTTSISTVRTSDLQRISWRFPDGPWAHDYIELNGDWAASGTDFCAHPNYATWYGFTTSSRYEALEVGTGELACADAGAEVTFSTPSCPQEYGPSDALGCDFHATQASIRDCSSVPALYQEAHTWAINRDGSRTPRYSCPDGGAYGEWCGNWVNYPCAPESYNWPGYGVGSWIDCTSQRKSIVFKLTTCI